MHISKGILSAIIIAILGFGVIIGLSVSKKIDSIAYALEDPTVDSSMLDSLYNSVFHRPVDAAGARFHKGRKLRAVLKDLAGSRELRYYGALFKAVKSYEEAVRAPGDLSNEDKQRYLNLIDSALATLIAWVETLPDQSIDKAVVGPTRARQAIREAYQQMNSTAQLKARKGLIRASTNLGDPGNLPLPSTASVSASVPTLILTPILPSTQIPTLTPILVTPTPTPIIIPSPTPPIIIQTL